MAIPERTPKVLLIGDSIKIGYSPFVKEELKDTAQTVYLKENGRFSAFVLRMLYDCYHSPDIGTDVDLIYWNCGLWDVLRIMNRARIQTDDLYQVTVGLPREYHSDWTHYTQEGYQYIARHVAETIKAELGKDKEQ